MPNDAPPSLLARLDRADRALSRRILAKPHEGAERRWVSVLHRISQTGSYGVGWVALFAVVVTFLKGPGLAALAAALVIGTLLTNTAIKLVLRRPRPSHNPIGEQPRTYSMPSAHTSMAVVGASVMTVLAPAAAPLWWAWAGILALSRIILGMHYVGDVLGGIILGLALALGVAIPLLHAAGA